MPECCVCGRRAHCRCTCCGRALCTLECARQAHAVAAPLGAPIEAGPLGAPPASKLSTKPPSKPLPATPPQQQAPRPTRPTRALPRTPVQTPVGRAGRPPVPTRPLPAAPVRVEPRPPLGRGRRRRERGVVRSLERPLHVANVYGSSAGGDVRPPEFANWRAFYVGTTGLAWPAKCQIAGCERRAAVGGHMYCLEITGARWNMLLPICYKHNNDKSLNCMRNALTPYGEPFPPERYVATRVPVALAAIEEKAGVADFQTGVLERRERPRRRAATKATRAFTTKPVAKIVRARPRARARESVAL